MFKNNKPIHKSQNLFQSFIKLLIILIIAWTIINYTLENTSLFYRKTIFTPFSLHLNRQELVMAKGEEFRLFVYGINKRVSYSSTNFRVVGVNFNGRLFAYNTGSATIVAKVDGKELKCKVKVIDLSKDKLTMKVGETKRLRVKGTNSVTKFKSSNSKVASVNIFGKVKAKKKGSAVITAKVKRKQLSCKVIVK